MIAVDLKESILHVATTGGLIKQTANNAKDELANILLDVKDDKKYQYIPITEFPFSIPSNWLWVKLEDICIKITDGTHKTPKYTDLGIPFVSVKDVSFGKISFKNTKFISEFEHKKLYKRCNPERGDLLITKIGTTGVPAIVETDVEFSLFVSVALLKINNQKIYNKYLYYILQSPVVQKQVKENTRGVGNKNWVLEAIKNTVLPLPPLEEQYQIVDRIEELFAKLDEIKHIEEELEKIKSKFPEDIKKSVLNDFFSGNASFIIESYDSWKSEMLINIADVCTGNSIPEIVKKNKYTNLEEGYNYIATKDLSFDHKFNYNNGIKIPYSESGFKYANSNDILMCIEGGSAGKKIGILTEKVCYGNKLCKFSLNSDLVIPEFLYYYLQSEVFLKNFYENLNGIIGGVSINKIRKIEIKFPSVKEQQRIVDKLEQLLPLCDDIEKIVNQ